MIRYPRALPVGDAALSFELGADVDLEVNARVRALERSLREAGVAGVLEAVPTHRSLLVRYDRRQASFEELCAVLFARERLVPGEEQAGRLHVVPVHYGGDDGPDLGRLAVRAGLAVPEAIALHASREYTSFMLGFLPGFAYLGLLPEALDSPRLASPRLRVAAGSVAIAGRQTGIYPTASPGGWNLVGRTAVRLFDPHAASPVLIGPGDRVRFVASEDRVPEPPPLEQPAHPTAPPAIEVVDGGLLTTVQAAPRRGYRQLGIPEAGPLDPVSLALANLALGNAEDAAALECTVAGPTLAFLSVTSFAVAGGDLGAMLERADLGTWRVPPQVPVLARPGNTLHFTGRRSGCRAYLAFGGGLDVPVVLGSRATDLASGFGGFGGRALRAGDLLALRPVGPGRPIARAGAKWRSEEAATLRVVLGPQQDHFTPAAIERLAGDTFAVGLDSDRVGCRLEGGRLEHAGPVEIASDGMVPGCVQVPRSGQPIVLLADGPTTGGYPKIATVVTADLPRLGQLLPGQGRLRFRVVTLDEAAAASPASDA